MCLVGLLLGCSDLSGTKGGVVALELRLQTPPVVEQFDTLVLVARALDADGREVATDIFWRSPDSILVVDSTGSVTTDSSSGSGRVQARTGSLLSDLTLLEIHRRSDTVVLTAPTTLTVPGSDTASAAMVAALQSLAPDTVGISNGRLLYEVVETAAATGKLRFQGGGLSLRAATSLTGQPVSPVTLRKVPGATPPSTVTVRVSATRPSGLAVPGSGQLFTVNFQ
jgi:hypothetical protein